MGIHNHFGEGFDHWSVRMEKYSVGEDNSLKECQYLKGLVYAVACSEYISISKKFRGSFGVPSYVHMEATNTSFGKSEWGGDLYIKNEIIGSYAELNRD